MAGLILIIPVLAFDIWLMATTGRSQIRLWLDREELPRLLAALGIGLALAVWMAFFMQFGSGPNVRALGFPIPLVFYHLQDKTWHPDGIAVGPALRRSGHGFHYGPGRAVHSLQDRGIPQEGENGNEMTAKTIMLVAGDPSADANAADLVKSLAAVLPGAQFIGAGGPKMAEAGAQLLFNLTEHSAIGPTDAVKNLGSFWRRRQALLKLAVDRRPGAIILVDGYSFNEPLARAVKKFAGSPAAAGWKPKIIRYTSPQVWASRPGRAAEMTRNIDLLLCFFPFEKDWYAKRGIAMRVEFVGHPMLDRYAAFPRQTGPDPEPPVIVLLPGSRKDELRRHLPVMLEAARLIAEAKAAQFKLVDRQREDG